MSRPENESKTQAKEPLYRYIQEESESTALEAIYGYLFEKLTEPNKSEDS